MLFCATSTRRISMARRLVGYPLSRELSNPSDAEPGRVDTETVDEKVKVQEVHNEEASLLTIWTRIFV